MIKAYFTFETIHQADNFRCSIKDHFGIKPDCLMFTSKGYEFTYSLDSIEQAEEMSLYAHEDCQWGTVEA